MTDSPRWCDSCRSWGDHHSDRCPDLYRPAPGIGFSLDSAAAREALAALPEPGPPGPQYPPRRRLFPTMPRTLRSRLLRARLRPRP